MSLSSALRCTAAAVAAVRETLFLCQATQVFEPVFALASAFKSTELLCLKLRLCSIPSSCAHWVMDCCHTSGLSYHA